MTKIEKQTIINALKVYSKVTEIVTEIYRNANNKPRTRYFAKEHSIAEGLISAFNNILDEPCGAIKI